MLENNPQKPIQANIIDTSEDNPIVNEDSSGDDYVSESTSLIAAKPKSFLKSLYEYIETFCYALVLTILLFMFLFRYVSVEGKSMNETLQDKDKLVISNLAYTPKTGDIVVIKCSPDPLIKRIIATEGQKVKIDYEKWEVTVEGNLLNESYISRVGLNRIGVGMNRSASGLAVDEFTVEKGKVFVMGDNRNDSRDSREFGQFEEKDVLGRVIFRVFPVDKFGAVD